MGDVADTIFGGGQQEAAKAQEEALRQAQQMWGQQEKEAIGRLAPYEQAGTAGLSAYQQALSGMDDPTSFYQKMMSGYQQSPLAQQQIAQGVQAAQRGAAAGISPTGGAEQKALTQYAQGVSSKDMQDYYNNMMNIYGGYLGGEKGLAGMGQQAATQAGQWGMNYGQGLAGLQESIGQAQAAGKLAQGQTFGNIFGDIGSIFGLGSGSPAGGSNLGYGYQEYPVSESPYG